MELPDGVYRAKWVLFYEYSKLHVFDIVGHGRVAISEDSIYGYCTERQLDRRELNLKFEPSIRQYSVKTGETNSIERLVQICAVPHSLPD